VNMASFASVHVSAANKTIVPWSVISLDPSQNFGKLFRSIQAGKYAIVKTSTDLAAAVLESSGVSVGKDKSSLSLVDKDLNTVYVCTTFGHYVKFTVTLNDPGVSSSLDVSRNAFEIMMQNQHCLSKPTLPDALVGRTKKDKLFNDLLRLVEQKGLKFSPGQLESGRSYLTTVTAALWYIDVQHACNAGVLVQ